MTDASFAPGDLIWYRAQTRGGDRGYSETIPAVFLRLTKQKARIRVTTKAGTEIEILVSPDNLRPRQSKDEQGPL